MNLDEIERIRMDMNINEQARTKRKGGDDMTTQEWQLKEAEQQNLKLQGIISKLTEKLSAMERQLKESEKQNGTILITADTINHVLDRVASVTFRK